MSTAAFTGTASAHYVSCIFFCGCGRMVAYGDLPKDYPVLVAKEGGGPGRADLNHYIVEGNENDNLETVQRGRGKILALVQDEESPASVWYNPNQCAQNVFDSYGGVEDTVKTHFPDKEYAFFRAGEKGHCHPPKDHRHDHC